MGAATTLDRWEVPGAETSNFGPSISLEYWLRPTEGALDFVRTRSVVGGGDATTTEYVSLQSGKEFAIHSAKLTAIAESAELWPDGADPPSTFALFLARVVLQQLEQDRFAPTRVVASAEGGVALCFVRGQKYADIECLNGGGILGVTSNRSDRPSAWEISGSLGEIARACDRIRVFLNT